MTGKNPTQDDEALFRAAMDGVTPLPARAETEAAPSPTRKTARSVSQDSAPTRFVPPAATGTGLDRRTEDRLRQGKMEIEGRLDLHGLTLAQAEPAVGSFIRASQSSGKRCVLIITGKGDTQSAARSEGPWYEAPRGQIRQNLPLWLASPDLSPLVLSIAPARPQHGGSGAVYVLLRRTRAR